MAEKLFPGTLGITAAYPKQSDISYTERSLKEYDKPGKQVVGIHDPAYGFIYPYADEATSLFTGLPRFRNFYTYKPSNITIDPLRVTDPDKTILHELEHDLLTRGLRHAQLKEDELKREENPFYIQRFLTNNKSYDVTQATVFKDAGGDSKKLEELFENPEIKKYLRMAYNFVPQGSLAENLTELSAAEQLTGKDVTNDSYLRKNLFKNHGDRIAYRATSGLRKTRLDSKDLQPFEPVPEADTSMIDRIIQYFTPNDTSLNIDYGEIPDYTDSGIEVKAGIGPAYDDDIYTNPLMKDPFE